jgi:nucleoside transporter
MATENETIPMGTRIQLSAMMFLQFMMIAVWWVPLSAYLKTLGIGETSYFALILSTMALGCLTSPIVGMVADRHFAGQKVLFVLNLVGGVLLVVAAYVTDPLLLFIVLLLHMLCYMPTWGLTSAIAMAHAPSEKFAQIRVFGSIGWVLAAVFSVVAIKAFGVAADGFDTTSLPMLCGAGVGIIGALLALTLPNTPPPAKGKEASIVDALGLRAMSLMSDFYFALYIVLAMLVMIPFAAYFNFGSAFLNDKGFQYLTLTMNLGQFAEMFFMLLVPIVLAKCGIRWTLILGLIALTVRYASFWLGDAFGITPLYFVAILVHGLIFGFFFVGGQVYVDKKAPESLRAQAQGMMFLMTFGLGTIIGNFVTAWLSDANKTPEGATDWIPVWMAMTVASAVMTVAFFLLFHDKIGGEEAAEGQPEAAPAEE